ncbi:MAG: metal-dependent transcriptional regulator [Chloroflexi bacterium]|jgi:DtxR family Mn-dependent transcriptional regulator|uniref:Manganese transport regulator n=1 Tax=Candidatus Thermofonsia Clade 3 bacterium TaxID=2364212 RepID=A0A2M8QEX4_9CHLR|nr:metal-dependent transcriptional regulator [Candidatus Roseilinea sp. NK_OTU-006]PJF48351.1 MAG: DtxR family transcriptional regulator [Candidatus Thermofonsia Clade 3 bacterium]RMG62280.1 MAG: metal-dependent transcriptional regulator [Chloroflexota bacterium]
MLSESAQDYLKAIYSLRHENARATTNALAARLNVTAASVTGMLKKLAELKLVFYEPYQGATLTPAGEKIALEVIRHHRLIELYLTEAMGYSWDQVHAEADRLEHAISEEFEDRISTLLGHPTVDPHGDPIPTKDGEIAASSRDTLDTSAEGSRVRIERVRDEDPALLRQVADLGLLPQTVITIGSRPDGASLTVYLADGQPRCISTRIAQNIFIVDAP